jgi:Tol biopolymer transport system component
MRHRWLLAWIVGIGIIIISGCGRGYYNQSQNNGEYSGTTLSSLPPIVFVSTKDGAYSLYTMKPDGSDIKRITQPPANTFNVIDTSPDYTISHGGLIAFISNRTGNFSIYIVHPDGTGLKQLTSNNLNYGSPVFSPDGNQIVYTVSIGSISEIGIMNIDGSNTHIVINNPIGSASPVWLTGFLLAYISDPFGSSEIRLYDLLNNTQLAGSLFSGATSRLSWSANNLAMLFISLLNGKKQVFKLNLFSPQQAIELSPDTCNFYEPAWSADGTKILMTGDCNGNPDIYLMSADGTGLTNLTHNYATNGYASWIH